MELRARAGARGHVVLAGAASEFERDLPFSVFVDALDAYVASQELSELAAWDADLERELGWKVADGEHRLVLMNADAGHGVAVHADFGVSLPQVTTIAWLLVGGGALAAGRRLGRRDARRALPDRNLGG